MGDGDDDYTITEEDNSFRITTVPIKNKPRQKQFEFVLQQYKLGYGPWQYITITSPSCYPGNFSDAVHRRIEDWLTDRYDKIDFSVKRSMWTTMRITLRTIGQARRLQAIFKQLIVLEQMYYPNLLLTNSDSMLD
jgi:hypothetical protein